MGVAGLPNLDRNVEGAVELVLDATTNEAEPHAGERHFGCQAALFPTRPN